MICGGVVGHYYLTYGVGDDGEVVVLAPLVHRGTCGVTITPIIKFLPAGSEVHQKACHDY